VDLGVFTNKDAGYVLSATDFRRDFPAFFTPAPGSGGDGRLPANL